MKMTHTIHVCYIYLHLGILVDFFMINVGVYIYIPYMDAMSDDSEFRGQQ